MRCPVLSNRSACLLALGKYERCVEDVTAALSSAAGTGRGRAAAKLLMRRGEARRKLGFYTEAEIDLQLAASAAQGDDELGASVSGAVDELRKLMLCEAAGDGDGAGSLVPKHKVSVKSEEDGRVAVVVVELPGVRSQRELAIELGDYGLQLSGAGYVLNAQLPFKVDVTQASAKFSIKNSKLKVTLPEVA